MVNSDRPIFLLPENIEAEHEITKRGILTDIIYVSLVITLVWFLIFLMQLPKVEPQIPITTDDFFKELLVNEAGLTTDTAIFVLANPTLINISLGLLTNNLSISIVSDNVKASNRLDIFVNVTAIREVEETTSKFVKRQCDDGNGTYDCSYWNITTISKKIIEEVFIPLNFSDFIFESGRHYKIKIVNHHPASLGLQSREWIPKIRILDQDYEKKEWAWWNISFSVRRAINISNQNITGVLWANTTINVTFDTTNSNLTGNNASNCSSVRIVRNDSAGNSAEINRYVDNCGQVNSVIYFMTQEEIEAGASLSNRYYLYYQNNTPVGQPPRNASRVWSLFDDFEDTDYDANPRWNLAAGTAEVGLDNMTYVVNVTADNGVLTIFWNSSLIFDGAVINFRMRPSGATLCARNEFYLLSDSSGVSTGQSYIFQLCGTNATITRLNGSIRTQVLSATVPYALRWWNITIERSPSGNWSLYTDGYYNGSIVNDLRFTGNFSIIFADNTANLKMDDIRITRFNGRYPNITLLDIESQAPTHANPIFSPSPPRTTQNLTCINQSTADPNGDAVYNIFDWRVNRTTATASRSLARANHPLDTNHTFLSACATSACSSANARIRDYSDSDNNLTELWTTNTEEPKWRNQSQCNNSLGGCWFFDGVNDIAIYKNPMGYVNLSVSLWFNTSADFTGAGAEAFGALWSANCWGTLRFEGNERIFWYAHQNGVAFVNANTGARYNDSVWHHIVARKIESQWLDLWIDNVFINRTAFGAQSTAACGNPNVSIGGEVTRPTQDEYDGFLDQVLVYDYAIDNDTIRNHYLRNYNILPNTTANYSSNQLFTSGRNVTCCITPTDSVNEGLTNCVSDIIVSSLIGQLSHSLTIQDSRSRAYIGIRSLNSSLDVEEGTGRITIKPRALSNSFSLQAVQARIQSFVRSLRDSITLADSAFRQSILSRLLPNSIIFSHNVLDTKIFTRQFSSSLTFADSMFRNSIFPRAVANSLSLTHSVNRLASSVREISNSFTLNHGLTTLFMPVPRIEPNSGFVRGLPGIAFIFQKLITVEEIESAGRTLAVMLLIALFLVIFIFIKRKKKKKSRAKRPRAMEGKRP